MLKGNQKRYLKGLANGISQRYLLGKGGIEDTFLKQIDAALEAILQTLSEKGIA